MLHEPASESGPDPAADYKASLGVKLFIVYCLVYAGFVLTNVFANEFMSKPLLFGLNLAVIYGFGLILIAMVMAIIYNHCCTKKERQLGDGGEA